MSGEIPRAEFEIIPGIHSVHARMDWVKSDVVEVAVKSGDLVQFRCSASGTASVHRISLIMISRTTESTSGSDAHDTPGSDRYKWAEVRDIGRRAGWWTVLELSADASEEQIRAAYLTRIRQYHPDKVAYLGAEIIEVAERRSKEINIAYANALEQRRKR
jgi:hypothetical protein